MSRRHRAPSWLAPILYWYEVTMQGLDRLERGWGSPQANAHFFAARRWRRHFEKPGMKPRWPIVLTHHAKERYRERYAPGKTIEEATAELEALLPSFQWTGICTFGGGPIASTGSVHLVLRKKHDCYLALTALPDPLDVESTKHGKRTRRPPPLAS